MSLAAFHVTLAYALMLDAYACMRMMQVMTTTRSHEVRVGMSVYWIKTYEHDDGFGWEGSGLSGYAPGSIYDAIRQARAAFLAREQEENAQVGS